MSLVYRIALLAVALAAFAFVFWIAPRPVSQSGRLDAQAAPTAVATQEACAMTDVLDGTHINVANVTYFGQIGGSLTGAYLVLREGQEFEVPDRVHFIWDYTNGEAEGIFVDPGQLVSGMTKFSLVYDDCRRQR